MRALVGDDEIVLDTTLLVCLLQHQSRSLGLIRKHVELPELQGLEVLRCPGAHLLLTALQSSCNLTKPIFEQANTHMLEQEDRIKSVCIETIDQIAALELDQLRGIYIPED